VLHASCSHGRQHDGGHAIFESHTETNPECASDGEFGGMDGEDDDASGDADGDDGAGGDGGDACDGGREGAAEEVAGVVARLGPAP